MYPSLRRFYESATNQSLSQPIDVASVSFPPDPSSYHDVLHFVPLYSIDDPVTLSGNANRPVTCKLISEWFALFLRLLPQSLYASRD